MHDYVTSISILQDNAHGTQYQISELQVLANGH